MFEDFLDQWTEEEIACIPRSDTTPVVRMMEAYNKFRKVYLVEQQARIEEMYATGTLPPELYAVLEQYKKGYEDMLLSALALGAGATAYTAGFPKSNIESLYRSLISGVKIAMDNFVSFMRETNNPGSMYVDANEGLIEGLIEQYGEDGKPPVALEYLAAYIQPDENDLNETGGIVQIDDPNNP